MHDAIDCFVSQRMRELVAMLKSGGNGRLMSGSLSKVR